MDCKICDIHHTKSIPMLVGETFHWVIRHSEFTKNAPGYLYIEPKRHVESYNDLIHGEFMQLGECMKMATEWIYRHFKPLKLYTITVSEAVPHLHFHLVPRFEDSPKGIEFLQEALSGKLQATPKAQAELERILKLFEEN
ncbi:MAG TPA: HIT domain-containing protein [Leptospiraceae bacterium]|nr:HIT domain-containing protein [Leptospiraceae bacterium]HMW03485.1 HIT domain-containing protein [Leptospiraceae bacterium]HMX34722.1 HIT domain-containing protein [Leptospiraceae bacterium]HMY29595.1 HIT domain-containing protein [Leptospiraceae bacterium]HMZ62915.1 HIT domain-containing protein [Leptospiraceae bacterium]